MSYSNNSNVNNVNPNDCHGCALCTLVCPVWQQQHDVRQTPHGLAKALQAGGELDTSAVMSCILCCACATICPQNINLPDFIMDLRKKFINKSQTTTTPVTTPSTDYTGKTVFIASTELQKKQTVLDRSINSLKLSGSILLAEDSGEDIIAGFESGDQISQNRIKQFIDTFKKAKKIIVCDGLLQHKLKSWLPDNNIISIGLALSSQNHIRNNLTKDDFYVIDSRAFNTNPKRSLTHYHDLHERSGCEFNLDLHRIAVPTGSYIKSGFYNVNNKHHNDFDLASQAQWLLSGRTFDRIVVEDIKDYELLPGITDKPVIHVSELAL